MLRIPLEPNVDVQRVQSLLRFMAVTGAYDMLEKACLRTSGL